MSQARLLNSEERIKRLMDWQAKRMAELKVKAEKRRERIAKKEDKRLARLRKQHAVDVKLVGIMPLVEVLVENGFHASRSCHPTIKIMRSFAKKQHIALSETTRDKIAAQLCDVVRTHSTRKWLKAEEEEIVEESESEETPESESGEEENEEDDSDDPEYWSSVRIFS